jgi:hypothetical protein
VGGPAVDQERAIGARLGRGEREARLLEDAARRHVVRVDDAEDLRQSQGRQRPGGGGGDGFGGEAATVEALFDRVAELDGGARGAQADVTDQRAAVIDREDEGARGGIGAAIGVSDEGGEDL